MFGKKSLKQRIEELENQHSHGLQSTLRTIVPMLNRLEWLEERTKALFDMFSITQDGSIKTYSCPHCGVVIDPKARLGRERQFGEAIDCPVCKATIYGKGAVAHHK